MVKHLYVLAGGPRFVKHVLFVEYCYVLAWGCLFVNYFLWWEKLAWWGHLVNSAFWSILLCVSRRGSLLTICSLDKNLYVLAGGPHVVNHVFG